MHAFHDDVGHGTIVGRSLAGIVHSHDVGLVELRCVLGLAAETFQEGGIARQIRAHHLHRDIAGEEFISCGVHVGHTAGADFGV